MSIREDFGAESRRWPLINKQRFQITRSKSEHCLSLSQTCLVIKIFTQKWMIWGRPSFDCFDFFSLFFCCFCFILLVSYYLVPAGLLLHLLARESWFGEGVWLWLVVFYLLVVSIVCSFRLFCLFGLFVWYYMVLLHLLAKGIMICGGSLACGRPSASVPKGDGPPTDITRLSYNQIARILNVSWTNIQSLNLNLLHMNLSFTEQDHLKYV